MRENRPSGSEGGVAFGPSLPLSGPFVNPPWSAGGLPDCRLTSGTTQVMNAVRHEQSERPSMKNQRIASSGFSTRSLSAASLCLAALCFCLGLGVARGSESAYARWTNGPSLDPSFFPIAVWLQSPANAGRYAAAGINTYVALWKGPTEEQLTALKKAGMKLICSQNRVGLDHLNDPTIIGWMHGDEPDNAQSLPGGRGYGPPIPPEKIVSDYQRIRAADPTRPVMLNLGQGVAWDRWHGRGVRSNHPEDYPEYMKGGDIISFDIYPVVHDKPEVAGQLWYVARGVERLVQWGKGEKVIWDCIECTRIGHATAKATPHQVKAEIWMSLIHGSRGLIYFVHEWKPRFQEAALLNDPEMLAAVTVLNRQITRLAPILNQPSVVGGFSVVSARQEVPVAAMLKGAGLTEPRYLFAVGMREGQTTATFKLESRRGEEPVEVLDENRTLTARDGVFEDQFKSWDAHTYRLGGRKTP